MRHLTELDDLGYLYYFLFTIVDYPKIIDGNPPNTIKAIKAFKDLSDRIGPSKVIFRYDPIVFTDLTDIDFHLKHFASIAKELNGYSERVIISVVDKHPNTSGRMKSLEQYGYKSVKSEKDITKDMANMFKRMMEIAGENNMHITSCAENLGLEKVGIYNGHCVDSKLIKDVFGIDVSDKKDLSQRKACGCVPSRDIGIKDTCQFGCIYCYATTSFDLAKERFKSHDPNSPSLVGRLKANTGKNKPGTDLPTF